MNIQQEKKTSLEAHVEERLRSLDDANLRRVPVTILGAQGPLVCVDGQELLCFCANNYLGLANHPSIIKSAQEAMVCFGMSASASRLISGTMTPHQDAERCLAAFAGKPAARLFSSGYAANVGCIQALTYAEDVIFSDALNHASLIDGCRLSRAKVHVYHHADMQHLAYLLELHANEHKQAWIITDGVFSMDGDRAPVVALRELADNYNATLMVDEAHAIGVLGPQGRGVCAEMGVTPDVFVGTLGKAFGLAGAFVAASENVVEWLYQRARSFVYSTAPPPHLAVAIQTATDLVLHAEKERVLLREHSRRLRQGLQRLGFNVLDARSDTPIVPVIIGEAHKTIAIAAQLRHHGVLAQGIRPPTVAAGTSRIRLVPMATHTQAHIAHVLQAFSNVAQ